MSFSLTTAAQRAANALVKHPSLALCIDGIDTKYGSSVLIQLIKIGDPGLFIDGSWVIGGFREVGDQLSVLSLDASTTSIKQQLDIDKGRGSSISSMELGLVDFEGQITALITPGFLVEDILGRKAKILLGFAENTSFPQDYITIHRGIIDDIKAEQGIVRINVAHPDQKKRSQIFPKVDSALVGAITDVQTTIPLSLVDQMVVKMLGPDGTYDPAFHSYVRIDDEVIYYDAISGLNLTGCIRGQLGTVNVAHDDQAAVSTFYTLEENVINLALKMMLSGWGTYFVTDVPITNFNVIGDASILDDSIFFSGEDLVENTGVVIGDWITVTGATNPSNNFSYKQITGVSVDDFGTVLQVDGVTFVMETDSPAVMSIRSQYDTLPMGCMMGGDEVDIAEHLKIQRLFLSSFDMRFYLKASIDNAKDFIEQELYKPAGSYSLPRKARASLGFFVGPIPGANIVFLDKDNITNPDKLKIRRTITKNFANTIVYQFEDDVLEDKFLRGIITQSGTSVNRIPVGAKPLIIQSKGMRKDLLGGSNATLISNRKLDRFKFGAEFLEGVDILYGASFQIEIGDIVILDGDQLNLANTEDGTREKGKKFFEVNNKTLNIINGKVTLDLVDTGFDGSKRYCLIGPSSFIKAGVSGTQFVIEPSFREEYGINEYKRWNRFTHARIKVRSANFTTRFAQSFIESFVGNQITSGASLSFTPVAGDVMELADYDFPDTTEEIKLLYGFMRDSAFADGSLQYSML